MCNLVWQQKVRLGASIAIAQAFDPKYTISKAISSTVVHAHTGHLMSGPAFFLKTCDHRLTSKQFLAGLSDCAM